MTGRPRTRPAPGTVLAPHRPASRSVPRPRSRPRPTSRAGLHLLLGLILYGAGANIASAWVSTLAALLLASLPWGWWQTRRALQRCQLSADTPPRTTAGADTPLWLTVHTPSRAAVVVRERRSGAAGSLPRGSGTLTGQVRWERGLLDHLDVEVEVSDPLGLWRATARHRLPVTTLVRPATRPLSSALGAGTPAAGWDGQRPRATATGPEVAGVREYRHGDPLRAIHWRSSARRNQPVVREFTDPTGPGLRIEFAAGVWPRAALDEATSLTLSLAEAAVGAGLPVVVAADGTVTGWSAALAGRLALLPPHLGAGPRPLAPPPPTPGALTVRLHPSGSRLAATVVAGSDRWQVPSGGDVAVAVARRMGGWR